MFVRSHSPSIIQVLSGSYGVYVVVLVRIKMENYINHHGGFFSYCGEVKESKQQLNISRKSVPLEKNKAEKAKSLSGGGGRLAIPKRIVRWGHCILSLAGKGGRCVWGFPGKVKGSADLQGEAGVRGKMWGHTDSQEGGLRKQGLQLCEQWDGKTGSAGRGVKPSVMGSLRWIPWKAALGWPYGRGRLQ